MHQQKIQNRQPNALQGVGLILLVALAIIGGSALFSRLAARIGSLSSLLFIGYGCAIAWLVLNWFVLGYIYTATDDCLRICRTYGKRERFIADVWLNTVRGYGNPDDVKKRFPGARVTRAVKSQSPFEPFALAYEESGRMAMLVIQPDEEMRAHLLGILRRK